MQSKNTEKEQVFRQLKANKVSILADKMMSIKYSDALVATASINREVKTKPNLESNKADNASEEPEVAKDTLNVTVVCNTSWFCDSQMDVLTSESYNDSVKSKQDLIPHIADHKQSSTAHVGDVQKVYTKKVSLKELGLDIDGETTALLMDSTIRKDYNADVYKFYANGKINQHSIGLRYLEIKMAINSPLEEYKEEYAIWKENYDKVINKDTIDASGYFYLASKVDIIENSCVLFGANSLTPTLAMKTEFVTNELTETLTQTKETNMTLEELKAQLSAKEAELAALQASVTTTVAKAITDERARCSEILTAGSTLKVSAELITKRITAGSSKEDALDVFTAVAEAKGISTAIDTAKSLTATITDLPSNVTKLQVAGMEDLTVSGILEAAKASVKGVK